MRFKEFFKFWEKNVVDCEKCKCVVMKPNAYRTVEMVNLSRRDYATMIPDVWTKQFFRVEWDNTVDRGDQDEYEIVEHFFCQKCKPKK